MFARVWRLLALRGVVAIAFAFVLLVWPDIGLTAMVAVVGAFAIASGFVSGVAAYALPGAATQHRVWLALNSLLGLAVGAAVLVWPDLSATALLYAIAIWAIADGRDRARRRVRAAAQRHAHRADRGERNRAGGVRRRDVRRAGRRARSRSWRSSPRSRSSAARSTSRWRSSCGVCSVS